MWGNNLAAINGTRTRLRKFLLSVSDLSGGGQEGGERWNVFVAEEVPTLAFPSIISDSNSSWWSAPPPEPPLMARPCLEDGSEGIPPRTTTVGVSGRSCDLLPLYTTMLGTGIIECVNRNHITLSSDKKILHIIIIYYLQLNLTCQNFFNFGK